MRHLGIQQIIRLGLLAGAILLYAPPASADLYGRSSYSACGYQSCPTPTPTTTAGAGTPTPTVSASPTPSATPPPVTVGTSPGGLEFAVNLSDGQLIPQGNYTITITPLNGQGKSFSQVEIFIDNSLAASVKPAATGTFYWDWSTGAAAKHAVKVVTYDQDGATTSRQFNVTIIRPTLATAGKPSGGSIPERIAEITHSTAVAVERAVKQIPVPVAVSFPYMLFALLGVGLLLLVIQARREVAEAEAMAAVIAHERSVAADKDVFVQLASHYLRTPLTVIANGVDLGVSIKQLDQNQAGVLKTVIDELRARIEQLLNAGVATAVTAPEKGTALHAKIWLRPGFFLPILLLGGLTLLFNVLVIRVAQINVGLINIITQLVLFGLLVLGLYVLLRGRTLRRRDAQERQRINEEQIRLDAARNQLIKGATAKLSSDVEQLAGLVPPLGDSQSVRIILDGINRFRQTLAKFGAAAGLQAGHAEAELEQFQLKPLLDQVLSGLTKETTEKNISIETPPDLVLMARHPNWLQTVIASLVDNAIAYSAPGSQVKIAAEAGPQGATITVADQGRGIAPATLQKLFRPFTKTEGALTFDNEGMGFSLYLDKLIMTYIGGDISIQSTLGRGTVATVRISTGQSSRPDIRYASQQPQTAAA